MDWEYAYYYIPLLRSTLRIWSGDGERNLAKLKKGYRTHNEHMRSVVPKKTLLEYHASQGWKPLCAFLGKAIPAEPMPKVNEGMWVAEVHKSMGYNRIIVGTTRLLKNVVPLLGVAIRLWLYRGGVRSIV